MKIPYPLEQLLDIKKRRLEEAEQIFRQKKAILDKEKTQLKKVEEDRDRTLQHKKDKMQQLREELDQGTTVDKIEPMQEYLSFVQEELKQKEKKVKAQQKKVEEAEKEVQISREAMLKKQQEVEKLSLHRKEWEKEQQALERHAEELETNELGTTIHTSKKRKGYS